MQRWTNWILSSTHRNAFPHPKQKDGRQIPEPIPSVFLQLINLVPGDGVGGGEVEAGGGVKEGLFNF